MAFAFLFTGSAVAVAAPVVEVNANSDTTAAPGGTLNYFVYISSIGDEPTSSKEVLNVVLPAGLTASFAFDYLGRGWECETVSASEVECWQEASLDPRSTDSRNAMIYLETAVDPGASGDLTSAFTVSGGGAASDTTVRTVAITPDLPEFGVDGFDSRAGDGPSGALSTQAGDHPDEITTSIFFNTFTNLRTETGPTWPVEPTKNVLVDLPPGFVGDPKATGGARCTIAQLANSEGFVAKPLCPSDSQVGVVKVYVAAGTAGYLLGNAISVYSLVSPADVPPRFGFNVAGTLITLKAAVRSGTDYGISVNVNEISQGLAIAGTELTFWGVPADASHDSMRSCPGQMPAGEGGPSCSSGQPERAFLRNPTSCTGPLATRLRIDSWDDPGDFREASVLSHEAPGFPYKPGEWGAPQGMTGCEDVPFDPTITVRATSPFADSPTGLDVDLAMPQSKNPDRLSQADVKDSRVSLPEGMVVNPAAAAGLVGCAQADVKLGNGDDPACPDASKIGTVTIESPQLEEELHGSIYQAKQFENPAGALLGFYTVAKGSGVTIKLSAHVERDPRTGRLTTVFEDSPQLPFDHYRLHFDDGPRAPLINPPTCGPARTDAVFTSWARPDEEVEREDSFQVVAGPDGGPCPNGLSGRPFAPKLEAGVVNPIAGARSPFILKVTREDGEQRLRGLTVSPPAGLSAYLKGVPYCAESTLASISTEPGSGAAEIASPSCPAASRIGTVRAGSGAGPLPFQVEGRAYLAGPYKGAPLSVAIVVPAVAGPIDLGSVVVRNAIELDPRTARLSVVSDPLPQIVHGVPLSLRSVEVAIDRPDFTLAPTSCEVMGVDSVLGGSDGATAHPTSPFQVGSCAALPFKPRLAVKVSGATKRGGNPALRAVLKAKPGEANIARVSVALPHSEFLAQSHIRTICTRVQYAAKACPKGSVYGHARAFTPLLDKPLEGPVYLRSSNNPLPDLVASLDGQIHIDLAGRIDSVNGGIRNTFSVVPDAPVSRFVLTMKGGQKGLLENSRNLCRGAGRLTVRMDGHNGKVHDTRPALKTSCGAKRGDARRHPKAAG